MKGLYYDSAEKARDRMIQRMYRPKEEIDFSDEENEDGAPYGNDNAAGPHKKIGRCNYPRNNGVITIEEDLGVVINNGVLKIPAGSEISGIEDFAGKGCEKPLEVEDQIIKKYGGKQGEWVHSKGYTTVELKNGKRKNAEVHWFECDSVGQVGMKIKRFKK